RHAAGDGALDAGAQDRRHYLERLEERRKLRRRATEATSSLSVPRGKGLGQFHAGVASSGGGAHGFEGEYPGRVRQRVSRATICPLRQPNKAIGLESPIEPWLAHCRHAACRRSRTARRTQPLMGSGATPRSRTEPPTGLDARHLPSPSPCGRGEVFSLTSPF